MDRMQLAVIARLLRGELMYDDGYLVNILGRACAARSETGHSSCFMNRCDDGSTGALA